MAAAQAGDALAYRKLLDELVPVVRRLVGARLSDPSAADDVSQNALLSIHRARRTYRSERPFGPWMRTIVRNAVIDSLREQQRRRKREVAVEHIDDWIDPAPKATPADGAEHRLSPELSAALQALPASQREAVELIHIHELSVAEAAARAGVSPGALKVRAHRGYRSLRQRLGSSRS